MGWCRDVSGTDEVFKRPHSVIFKWCYFQILPRVTDYNRTKSYPLSCPQKLTSKHAHWYSQINLPYILAYKSLPRISRPLKIESICCPKSLTRV